MRTYLSYPCMVHVANISKSSSSQRSMPHTQEQEEPHAAKRSRNYLLYITAPALASAWLNVSCLEEIMRRQRRGSRGRDRVAVAAVVVCRWFLCSCLLLRCHCRVCMPAGTSSCKETHQCAEHAATLNLSTTACLAPRWGKYSNTLQVRMGHRMSPTRGTL